MGQNPNLAHREYKTIMVSIDYTDGLDKSVMLVGTKKRNKIEVLNCLQGDEAIKLYEKLTKEKLK